MLYILQENLYLNLASTKHKFEALPVLAKTNKKNIEKNSFNNLLV